MTPTALRKPGGDILRIRRDDPPKGVILAVSAALLICHLSIFIQFFPNRYGRLGHDYAIFLPALVDGFCWYTVNGPLAVPWFTPSFSGGGLGYLHIERAYYTLPQLLAVFMAPLTVVRVTFAVFAAVGYAGCYGLLRRAFGLGRWASLMGACLFLFNGFYAHRMIVGHFGASPFMLLPVLAQVLLHPLPSPKGARRRRMLTDAVLAGLILAYMVQTWFALLMIPGLLAVVAVGLVHGMLGGPPGDFWRRLCAGGAIGLMCSASKVAATVYLMQQFDRSGYSLPGAPGLGAAAALLARALFVSPAVDADRMAVLTHADWFLGRHEWEFSLTPVALVILILGGWGMWRGRHRFRADRSWGFWIQAAGLAAIVLSPVLLNTYAPAWHQVLKQLPLIKSASSLVRWFIIPIPVIVVGCALTVDRAAVATSMRGFLVLAGAAAVVCINAASDRGYYHRQGYDPAPMTAAYRALADGTLTPGITALAAATDASGNLSMVPGAPNDLFVRGLSPILSYDAFFGYRQEFFPLGTLHPGPVTNVTDGRLNIKNPACYVWPRDNGCRPGDHFTVEQWDAAMAFVNYRPFAFHMPPLQRAANILNLLSLALALAWLLAAPVAGYGSRRRFGHPADRGASEARHAS